MTSLLSSTTAPTMPTVEKSALSGSGALVSEREAVERERAAFLRGRAPYCADAHGPHPVCPICTGIAAKIYRLPVVTRPRVAPDPLNPHIRWCVRDGGLAVHGSEWLPSVTPTAARVALWLDLFANPTEQVEDDSR